LESDETQNYFFSFFFRQSNSRIEELEKRNSAYEKFHDTFYDTRAQLTEALRKIDDQQLVISHLKRTNSELITENLALVNKAKKL
jgi:hypothetical protein